MKIVILLWLAMAGMAAAQEGAPPIYDLLYRHEAEAKRIPGVRKLSVAKVDGRQILVVQVEHEQARRAIRALWGETLQGHPVYVMVTPSGDVPTPGRPAEVAAPRPTVPSAPSIPGGYDRCDVFRKWAGLPPLPGDGPHCEERIGRTNEAWRVHWILRKGLPHEHSEELGFLTGSQVIPCPEHRTHAIGEVLGYKWVRHRALCPLGMRILIGQMEEQTPD